MKINKTIFLLIVLAIACFKTKATHLMGGSFVYEYVDSNGTTSTPYRYKLRIQMFRDCTNSQTLFDPTIQIGVYNNDSTKSKYKTISISNPTLDFISGNGSCSFQLNMCVQRGIYQAIIELPYSTKGFHFIHLRCCRSNNVNLIVNSGQAYYTFILPAGNYNNSPNFSELPKSYICSGDTMYLSYSAIDPDGDSLSYSIITPLSGGSQTNPAPAPPDYLNFPLAVATYANGYSLAQPFGNTGFVEIDSSTGEVKAFISNAGFYSFAVEVKEFRNGELLSTIIRDVDFVVLHCPQNIPPNLIGETSYTINAGRTLSFDITYNDSDSIYITRTGLIFDTSSGKIQPPYPILDEVKGKGTTSTKFKWNTVCHHVNNNPYFFTVYARDNGCPSKVSTNIFQVLVESFKGPDNIIGPYEVFEYDSGIYYTAKGFSNNSTVLWQIEGGQIISNDTDKIIEVNWGSAGTGIIRVIETIGQNCGYDTLEQQINIKKTVGIPDNSTTLNDILIYPNPTDKGYFNINVQGICGNYSDQQNSNIVIRLFDMRGLMIHEEDLNCRLQNKVDLSNKSKGVYYLKVLTETETYIKKIISF